MRRIRIALLLLGAGLLAPVGFLVLRALAGVAVESALRHETVAERAFDEMERELSRFLREEEARPLEHYRFYLPEPDPLRPGRPLRSPLSRPSPLPFVVGAFQVDADGGWHTPLRPQDPERARAAGDWPPAPELRERLARIDAALARDWASRTASVLPPEPAAAAQQPGSTLRLGDGPVQARRSDAAPSSVDELTAYDVLQRLNRASEERAERKQKVSESSLRELYESGPAEPTDPRAAGSRAPRTRALSAPEAEAAAEKAERDEAAEGRFGDLDDFDDLEDRDAFDASTVRVVLEPMIGRAAGDAELLLYRTVVVGRQAVRQGLLLDRNALSTWLEARVIAPSGLAGRASLRWRRAGALEDGDGPADHAFQHRFAEPFDALTARLSLEALPGLGSALPVYLLAGLALLVGAAGLLAVERMVSVVVRFAERRNNFVAAVSHELKTPLTAIRMYAEMLRDGLVDSEAKRRDYTRTISDESERLSRLIDNVLEFSRLERGGRELRPLAGALGPVLEEAAEKLRPHAERHGFLLRVEVEPGLPAVRFDADALLQVLFNLVDNAIKYARDAQLREVRIEARRGEDGIRVAVRDWGPGVARQHLRRLFEPFYRAEDELTRSAKGTGIGLALVKELGERMGAAVSGGNAQGGGFEVWLAFRPAV